MTKTLKQLVHVLWAIEKDLSVIASNTEAFRMRYVGCDDPGPKGPLGHPNVSKKQGNIHENPELLEAQHE